MATAQIEVKGTYPPLHAGIGSQGAQPLPQAPDPVLFFEGKVNWPALGIAGPRTAWEYAQRGIYRQDELEDIAGAVADYLKSESMNDRILIVQARLGVIALKEGVRLEKAGNHAASLNQLEAAIAHFDHILEEAPFHQGIHFKRGEAYEHKHAITHDPDDLAKAEAAFRAELALAPNSQRTHFALAQLFRKENRLQEAIDALDAYLRQAKWHSDPYPFRILKARQLRQELAAALASASASP